MTISKSALTGKFKTSTFIFVPVLSRGMNLLFTPFILMSFGSEDFLKISLLTFLSFLVTVTAELGVRQKVLLNYDSKATILRFYYKWLFTVLFALGILILLHYMYLNMTTSKHTFYTIDLIVISVDAIINITINCFYIGYLQARGRTTTLFTVNLQILCLVFLPRILMLLINSSQPEAWVFFSSVFRMVILLKILRPTHFGNTFKNQNLKGTIKVFEKTSLNSVFSVFVVLTLTLDKIIGYKLYDQSSMVAYLLAYQFVSLSGSIFEQVLIRYHQPLRLAIEDSMSTTSIQSIFYVFVFLSSLLNIIYFVIGTLIYPDLDAIFYSTLYLLSLQPLSWSLLVVWQNIIGPFLSDISHVKCMAVSVIANFIFLITLVGVASSNVIMLSVSTSGTYILCLTLLGKKSLIFGLRFINTKDIFFTSMWFLLFALLLNTFRESLVLILAISYIFSILFMMKLILGKHVDDLRAIVGFRK